MAERIRSTRSERREPLAQLTVDANLAENILRLSSHGCLLPDCGVFKLPAATGAGAFIRAVLLPALTHLKSKEKNELAPNA